MTDETPTDPTPAAEPTYQDWQELQYPTCCSWCSALVPFDRQEEHTTWHLDQAAILRALRDDVIALQAAQSTA